MIFLYFSVHMLKIFEDTAFQNQPPINKYQKNIQLQPIGEYQRC